MIGILGGMGTQAGLDFCNKLAMINRGKIDQDYPLFILYNKANIPGRPENLHNYNKVLKLAEKAHRVLKCKGVTRSDFKLINNKFYLLEINTQPGMTDLSLVPEIAKYIGITFNELIKKVIDDATINR